MDKDHFITIILQLDYSIARTDLFVKLTEIQNLLKKRFVFHQTILIPHSEEYIPLELTKELINSFSNLLIIRPLSEIDEDLAAVLGLENSIGEVVINAFLDLNSEELIKILNKCEYPGIVCVDLKNRWNNVFLLNRSQVNTTLNQIEKKDFIFIISEIKNSFENLYKLELNFQPRKIGSIINLLKFIRIVFRNKFLPLVFSIQTLIFILFLLKVHLNEQSSYVLNTLVISLIYLFFSLIIFKIFRKSKKKSFVEYNSFNSSFNHKKNLNIK